MWSCVIEPTPVLNTPHFSYVFGGRTGNEILKDEKGRPFAFEFVALSGMPFWIEEPFEKTHIVRVTTPYYTQTPLYVDARFLNLRHQKPSFPPKLPDSSMILAKMQAALGKPYVWGGNWSQGISKWTDYYPPRAPLDEKTKTLWTFKGLDCSGLLYEATKGATPRNTQDLMHFGRPLPIEGLSVSEILPKLKPLDMILYPGHVLFVFDENRCIESRSALGVVHQDLKSRLSEISNRNFSIRRFL